MTKTVRLTMAQAVTRFLSRQMTVIDGKTVPIFGGVWAIFGHGNVAGIGEALYQVRDELPTFRAHNEQAMAHAAIAYAKANFRRRFMAATSSIGPGALNMVTAAALAHVNRLPILFLPGDVFANRLPEPPNKVVQAISLQRELTAAGHNIAAAHWAILESVNDELLRAEVIIDLAVTGNHEPPRYSHYFERAGKGRRFEPTPDIPELPVCDPVEVSEIDLDALAGDYPTTEETTP